MNFDTSWNVDECKSIYESSDQWQFRQAFLSANKHKYPRNQLVVFSNIFINIEFEECRYPKPIMDHIENLSKSFVDNLRVILKLQKNNANDSNAAGAKNNENTFIKYLSPWDGNYIIPGFMLVCKNHIDQSDTNIIKQSCSFSGIRKPSIKYEHLKPSHYRAKLFLEEHLIAVGNSYSKELAKKNVICIAFKILSEMCFTLKVKEYTQSRISLLDVMDDSAIDTFNCSTYHSIVSEYKVGNMILKNMGWKEGDGLGKNNQGITSPIETIRFKERFGLDIENYDTKANTNRRHLIDFNIQAETYIMTFLYSPIKRMSFSTDFTKDERKIIHSICTSVGIWTKTYGKKGNKRNLVAVKKQTPKEIFDELCNYSNFENDYYILLSPRFNSVINNAILN